MFLLKDEFVYGIKVDVFFAKGNSAEVNEEYTKSMYLAINIDDDRNLLVFEENITGNVRVFDTAREAEGYLEERIFLAQNYENIRIVQLMYDFNRRIWVDEEI